PTLFRSSARRGCLPSSVRGNLASRPWPRFFPYWGRAVGRQNTPVYSGIQPTAGAEMSKNPLTLYEQVSAKDHTCRRKKTLERGQIASADRPYRRADPVLVSPQSLDLRLGTPQNRLRVGYSTASRWSSQ